MLTVRKILNRNAWEKLGALRIVAYTHTHLDIIYIIYTQNYLVVCEPFRIRLELLKRTGPGTGALRQTLRHHRWWQINHCAWPVATTRLEGSLWCNTMIFVICGCVWNGMYSKLRISFLGKMMINHWIFWGTILWETQLGPRSCRAVVTIAAPAGSRASESRKNMSLKCSDWCRCSQRTACGRYMKADNAELYFTVLSTIVKSSTAWRTSAIAHKQRRPTNECFADVCSYLALRTVEICITQEPLTHGTCKRSLDMDMNIL